VSNTSLVGTGFYVTKIDRPNSAFLDKQNQNVLTYFNKGSARFEAYDSFAVKVVLLSSDGVSIPFVDDVRAIAVSA
jgi:flagellar hook-associated protein FlgK